MSEALADLITKMLKFRVSEEQGKELMDKYQRPSNIPMLTNPKVNLQIWAKLKDNTKKGDLRLAHVGDRLVKMIISGVNLVKELTDMKDKVSGDTRQQVRELMRPALDTVQLGTQALHELSQPQRHKRVY